MSIVDRVKAILFSPKTEWPVIEAEPGDIGSIYKDWLIWLAAIPAIASLIGWSFIGVGMFGVSMRMPFSSGLSIAIFSFVMFLVLVYVLAMIVDWLAPKFGGQKNMLNAFKLVAYGVTAAAVAGIANIMPMLSILALIGAIYTIYLMYLGLPVLMKCPPDKAVPYTIVLLVCGFVANLVINVGAAMLMPGMGPMGMGMGDADMGDISIKTPSGEIKIDGQAMGEVAKRFEEAGKRIESANKKVEAAGKSGDMDAVGRAAAEAMAAISGAAGGRQPIDSATLKAMLPASIGGMKRERVEAQSGGAMGIAGSSAEATYRGNGRKIDLEITDAGGLAGLMSLAGWANVTGEREDEREIERTYKQGARWMREKIEKDGTGAELMMVLENGVMIDLEGEGVDLATLKSVLDGLDLKRLESFKTPPRG